MTQKAQITALTTSQKLAHSMLTVEVTLSWMQTTSYEKWATPSRAAKRHKVGVDSYWVAYGLDVHARQEVKLWAVL